MTIRGRIQLKQFWLEKLIELATILILRNEQTSSTAKFICVNFS